MGNNGNSNKNNGGNGGNGHNRNKGNGGGPRYNPRTGVLMNKPSIIYHCLSSGIWKETPGGRIKINV